MVLILQANSSYSLVPMGISVNNSVSIAIYFMFLILYRVLEFTSRLLEHLQCASL